MRMRIIRPSSQEQNDLLEKRLVELRYAGHEVLYDESKPDPDWAYTAASPVDRANSFVDAMGEKDTDVVWAARGGYGASEMFPYMNWAALGNTPMKWLVGFSDISAIQCALYAKLGRPSIHGPMPATSLWKKNDDQRDVDTTFQLLSQLIAGRTASTRIKVTPVTKGAPETLSGTLFGGCFSVISQLMGTPYFPQDLSGHLLFIEDLDEHPGRLMRLWQQWVLSGIADKLAGVVVGNLKKLGTEIDDNAEFVLARFAKFSPVPVYHSRDFGHDCPNFPMIIGADATINKEFLDYSYTPKDS